MGGYVRLRAATCDVSLQGRRSGGARLKSWLRRTSYGSSIDRTRVLMSPERMRSISNLVRIAIVWLVVVIVLVACGSGDDSTFPAPATGDDAGGGTSSGGFNNETPDSGATGINLNCKPLTCADQKIECGPEATAAVASLPNVASAARAFAAAVPVLSRSACRLRSAPHARRRRARRSTSRAASRVMVVAAHSPAARAFRASSAARPASPRSA